MFYQLLSLILDGSEEDLAKLLRRFAAVVLEAGGGRLVAQILDLPSLWAGRADVYTSHAIQGVILLGDHGREGVGVGPCNRVPPPT